MHTGPVSGACATAATWRAVLCLGAAVLALAGCGGGSSEAVPSTDDGTAMTLAARSKAGPNIKTVTPTTASSGVTASFDAEGWARWQRRSAPVYSGPYALVGDPSILRDGSLLRMFHTCYDVVRQGPAICQVTSTDGYSWAPVPVQDALPGRMLHTRPGKWDDTHETPLAIKFKGEYLLYYAGYQNRGGHLASLPIQIGLATSIDGEHFSLASDEPVLSVSSAGMDSDAVFSPTIIEHEGGLVMLYTAYCLDTCTQDKGVYVMAATSADGRTWSKISRPVISRVELPPGVQDIAEVHVAQGPDQQYYLFATYLYAAGQGHEIGIGRAATPYGPWQLSSVPVVRRVPDGFDDIGPIAPTVLMENGTVRMWFHGFSSVPQAQIGYAEAPWPLRAP